jgi:DNA-binding winged helix-turn-helix (wHTH) protein/tetratricopeptide (TPR) repeat protein
VDEIGQEPDLYAIGEFEVEPATRRLRRRDGTPIHLANRPFQVLLFLIAHRDRLVTRRELLYRFWGGHEVYDDSLTRCLSSVRSALRDRRAPARYVETRWAQGYRFIGPCEERCAAPFPVAAERQSRHVTVVVCSSVDAASAEELARQLRSGPSDIGLSVAEALESHVKSGRRNTAFCSHADFAAAAEFYRRGLLYHNDYGRRSQRYALQMFRRALAHDPDDARAWAGIAASYVLLCLYADGTEEDRRLAAEASERAIALDPLAAEAHVACAQLAVLNDDHAAAEQAFVRAETLDPQQFFAWLGHARSRTSCGDHERAVELYERAAQVRPDDYHALALAEQSYRKLGLLAESQRAAERCVAAGERVLAVQPDNVRAMSLTSSVLPELNRHAEAEGWTERAFFLEPDEPFVNMNAACVYVELGEHGRAFDFLERMPLTAGNRRWIDHDPTLDPLRDLPRFRALWSHTLTRRSPRSSSRSKS